MDSQNSTHTTTTYYVHLEVSTHISHRCASGLTHTLGKLCATEFFLKWTSATGMWAHVHTICVVFQEIYAHYLWHHTWYLT